IARRLQVPPAEVYGVASFYALVSTEPRPPIVAHVCSVVACGHDLRAVLGDGGGVVQSPCLGQCDRRPAVFIQRAGTDDVVLTGATRESVLAAIEGRITDATVPFVSAGPLLARVGNTDPESLDDYRAAGGYEALARAIEMGAVAVIDEIVASNLRGRGGARSEERRVGKEWRGRGTAEQ